MPLYEYACQKCGQIIEVRQRFDAAPPQHCEARGGGLQKLISRTAFTLKGGGWYDQGYCSASGSKPAACPAPAAGSCGG